MKLIDKNKHTLVTSFWYNDEVYRIYYAKSYFPEKQNFHYFFKLYNLKSNGNLNCLGYIYFYLDEINKNSKYIGTYINPSVRGKGLASLLLSYWIIFCLDNNYTLETNHTQKKPFLLYLLKLYAFEIENPKIYNETKATVSICQKDDLKTKYLYFRSFLQKQQFLQSKIYQEDNYVVLDDLENAKILDNVILSAQYQLTDENYAYNRSINTLRKFIK